jgi:CBS domain-containing protein
MRVDQLMNADPPAVLTSTSVSDLAKLMVQRMTSSLPVIDEERRVVGVVTMTDLVVRNAHLQFPRYLKILDSVIFLESTKEYDEEVRRVLASTAGELMSSPAMTVHPQDDAADAATRLFEHKITALPVVDDDDRLLGLLSQFDFVKLIASDQTLGTTAIEVSES